MQIANHRKWLGYLAVFTNKQCAACNVYQDLVKSKEKEIERLSDLLKAERESREKLEERLLRFIRVIPSEQSTIQVYQPPQTVNSRLNWPAEKTKLEKELAAKTVEGESRRLYWAEKARKADPVVEHSGQEDGKTEESLRDFETQSG